MRSNQANTGTGSGGAGTILRIGGALLALVVLAAALVLWLREPPKKSLTAYFTGTVGLYPGADVRILGLKVGEVSAVDPVGDSVRVRMWYEADHKVPATAQAVIINQSLVSDRYIQLTPVYKGGPVMPDDPPALGTNRTAVPVEVDQIGKSLNDLSKGLGPEGANSDGALSRLLQTSAQTFQGQGADIRSTIDDTAKMLNTLSADREDVAQTIKNLRIITDTMKANDRQISQFTQHLNGVSGQLAGEKEELSAALNTLAPTLRNVRTFIKDNRGQLADNVRQLAQITGILVEEKDAFTELLTTGPMAINNLARAYDPISGTIHNRADLRQFHDLADWVCSLAYSVGTPPKQCLDFMKPYNGIGKALTGLSLDLSWLTALTTHYDPVPIPPDAYGPNAKKGSSTQKGGGNNTAQSRTQSPVGHNGKPGDIGAMLPGGGE